MDLFKKKCPAHNLILGQRESCPLCLDAKRAKLHADTPSDWGWVERAYDTTEERRDPLFAESARFYFMPPPDGSYLDPEKCPHAHHYDSYAAMCWGCGLTARQLVKAGYATVRK